MEAKSAISLIGGFVALTGCGTVPKLPSQYRITIADVVNNVRCELRKSGEEVGFLTKGPGWTAGATLSLQVVEAGGIGTDPRLDVPLTPGLVVVTAGGNFAEKADSKSSVTFVDDLEDWADIPCEAPAVSRDKQRQLQGDLKIQDWLRNVDATIETTKMDASVVTYTVEFTIEKGLSAGPTFSLIPAGNNLFGVAVKATGGRKDVHNLTIAFSKNKQPEKTPIVGGKRPKKPTTPSAANVDNVIRALDVQRLINSLPDR